jgi:anti-sigma factor ChrR (cupin superfamily)
MRTVRKAIAAISVVCMIVAWGCVRAEEVGTKKTNANVRVGTYDSRAIAVASVDSERCSKQTEWLKNLKAEQDKAKAEGNQKRVAELEAEGQAHLKLRHKQGFSTAPVDDILANIKDKMPDIAKAANVSAIVSKWDKETLAKYKSAELVDVTMALVDALHPNERQRKWAVEIQKHPPITLEEAENLKD